MVSTSPDRNKLTSLLIIVISAAAVIFLSGAVRSGSTHSLESSAIAQTRLHAADLTPKFAISGVVRDTGSVGLAGVIVTLSGSVSVSTITAIDGSYSFSPVPAGGSYSVSASLAGYVFSPPIVTFNNLASAQVANFGTLPTTYIIRGFVKDPSTGGALFGALVSLSGTVSEITTLSSDGSYAFYFLPAGGTYTTHATVFQPGQNFSRYVLPPPLSHTFTNLSADASATFTGKVLDYDVGIAPNGMAIADFNGDGKPDLAVASGGTDGALSLLLNSGSGVLQNPVNIPFDCSAQSVVAGDFNRDGLVDLATADSCTNNHIGVMLGNGNGTFRPLVPYPISDGGPVFLATGDLNGDGILDLVSVDNVSVGNNGISILLGIGDGTFANPVTFNGGYASSVVLGDFNHDGRLDLVTGNGGSNNISILLGNGNGTFQPAVNYPSGLTPVAVKAGDLNADGNLDLVVTNRVFGNPTVSVLMGDGAGSFISPKSFPVGDEPHGLALGDLNGDGKLDLAVACFNGGPVTLLGKGDGTFQPAVAESSAAGNPNTIAIGDLNSDGKNDLAVTIYYSNKVSVLLNVMPDQSPATIKGRVTTSDGASLAGVSMSLAGSQYSTTLTDSDGNYAFTNLPAGGTYVVTPAKVNTRFSPEAQTYNDSFGEQTGNFTVLVGALKVVGRVTDANGIALGGATVTLSGAQSGSALTNENGTYSFLNLPAGKNYVVTPSFAGAAFIPVSLVINNLSFDATVDFGSTVTRTMQFDIAMSTVDEGVGFAAITVTRSGNVSAAASVGYETSDGTARQSNDYTIASGTLTFAPGETSRNFGVLITDNNRVDGPRTINLSLRDPVGAGFGILHSSTLTILDNDTASPTANPLDNSDAHFFVRQHYYDFLSRVPDPDGFSFWTGQITQCGSDQACLRSKKIDVSNAFFYELEYQQTGSYVYRLYRVAYGNNQPFPNPVPDANHPGEEKKLVAYQTFVADRGRVVGGASLAQAQLDLARAFVQRPEFVSKYPASLDGPGFVDELLARLRDDLGVDLGAQRAPLINLLNSDGRGAVLYRLADDNAQTNPINNRFFIDAEYNRAFVATQYFGYLRRDPDMGGFLFWLGQVSSAPLRDVPKQHAMVCSFTTSAEFQLRFSSLVTHTNGECQ